MLVRADGSLGVECLTSLKRQWVGLAAFAVVICTIPLYGLSFAQIPHPQRHDTRHLIDDLEESWRSAVLSSNASALASILSDDYMAITPSGTLQNKDDALSSLRNGHVHFASLTLSDRKVRFYGSTAIVTSLASVEATNSDVPVNGNYRYTHVYARDPQGKWKIVSFEASRVREPGAHHGNELR